MERNHAQLAMCLVIVSTGICFASPQHYENNYMHIDIRQIAWPEATLNTDPSKNYSLVDCYTELDRSFIGGEVRLTARKQLGTRSCMLRIPTRTRVQLKPVGTEWAKGTYVWLIAGQSYTEMPLRTKKIHNDEPRESSNWGPWHVPCSHAYIVFHAENPSEETLELRFTEEIDLDAFDPRLSQCDADGRNYAMADI